MKKNRLYFEQSKHPVFYSELKVQLAQHLAQSNQTRYANRFFWLKAAVNFAVMVGTYLALVLNIVTAWPGQIACAILCGMSSLLLIFNVAHDAVHGTLSPHRWLNVLIYRVCFIFVGISGRLWAMRHLNSHHVFTNVNGSDVDIDENPFLRLSPNHPRRSYQRFQHLYALFVYWIALPHTTFYQDFIYLFKRELANMRNITHPWYEYLFFIGEKLIYFALVFVLPLYAMDLSLAQLLLGYGIAAIIVSTTFVLTLIGTHFAMETSFPIPNKGGCLPDSWALHVMKTSLDWSPLSKLTTALFGGANAHVAHHLFPTVNHMHYAYCTGLIQASAKKYSLPYKSTNLPRMLCSHFAFLKHMAVAA